MEWTIPATVERVIDGDTYEVTVNLPFNLFFKIKVRLMGIDTHEMDGKREDSAHAQKEFVKDWFADRSIFLKSPKRGTVQGGFGRWLFYVEDGEGNSLGEALKRNFEGIDYHA